MPTSPTMRSTGATTPPATIAPASGHQSARASRTRGERITSRYNPSPTPEPVYNNPASSHGFTLSSSIFATGVPAPKSTAEASAA